MSEFVSRPSPSTFPRAIATIFLPMLVAFSGKCGLQSADPGWPAGRAHAILPACRTMLRIMSGKMKAWNGNMEYQ